MAQRRLIQAIYDQQALLKSTTEPSETLSDDVCEVQIRSEQFKTAAIRNAGKKIFVFSIYLYYLLLFLNLN